jgi:glutamine---fructose-6-phosphate transaminase (isomerizing)
LTRAGPEIGVASTKAFTTQLTALGMLVVALDASIQQLAESLVDREHALFVGRGALSAVAMEGALKLKEISYIHAEAYPAAELKHGPLALVDEEMPVIAVVANNELLEKLSRTSKRCARGGTRTLRTHPWH